MPVVKIFVRLKRDQNISFVDGHEFMPAEQIKKESSAMRRKEKEITDRRIIRAIIEKSKVCRLSMTNGKKPYIVPLCFGYQEDVLYFHSALKGQKMDLLRMNPNVCFEFDTINEPLASENPCDWSMRYQSVIGFGKVDFIETIDEKRKALDIIMAQYADRQFQMPENKLKAIAVFKIEIESMTGKQSGL